MLPSEHPWLPLVGPLRFACARAFANLGSVRGLRGTLSAALSRSAQKVAPARLAALEAELAHIDSTELGTRIASIRRVVELLRDEGLRLDELANLGPKPEPPQVPRRSKPSKGKASGTPAPAQETAAIAQAGSLAPGYGCLATPLKQLGWRLSPRLVGLLKRKGLARIADVLFLLPRTYEDRRTIKRISQIQPGQPATIVAQVLRSTETSARGRKQFRALLTDGSGSITAVYFQTGPWLKARFPIGKRMVLSGEVRQSDFGLEVPHPEIEPAEDVESSHIHFNRLVPVYPGFERHEQRALRELTFRIAGQFAASIEEPLPHTLCGRLGLLGLGQALVDLHCPRSEADLELLESHTSAAHQRLAFDELFLLQLGMALRRQGVKAQPGIAFEVSSSRVRRAWGLLPFSPTSAQERVVEQVYGDMGRPEPMSRLVMGDVGSGKTAVAVMAAAMAVQGGFQVVVMAPTEILAQQHHRTFQQLLLPLGARVELVTGSGARSDRGAQRAALVSGHVHVAVGTHALIQESVEFQKLGLVIIDEQHRFGVIQRQALMRKGALPDVMVMTATPIPRTLAMTLYGDLDVSVIDQLPPGRTPIHTQVVAQGPRGHAWDLVRAELRAGRQAYVVYPLVEESEKVDLADATQGAQKLRALIPEARVGLLHGRMKQDEKDAVMASFRGHQIDVLVSTSVVEVGVDVPNASVMVIEHAERFGLSSLHQLRGRVGRGAAKSHCILVTSFAKSEEAAARLGVMEESADGFVIAQRDLEIRGPGEFLGTRQSGLPELAVANLVRDQALLATAREEALAIVAADPELKAPEHQALRRALESEWEGRLKLANVA